METNHDSGANFTVASPTALAEAEAPATSAEKPALSLDALLAEFDAAAALLVGPAVLAVLARADFTVEIRDLFLKSGLRELGHKGINTRASSRL